jgi:hypothetical protein
LPGVRKTTVTYLAILTYGILTAQSLVLASIARNFPVEAILKNQKHQVKRLSRILNGPLLIPTAIFPVFMRWAVAQAAQAWRSKKNTVFVLMDYTSIANRFQILWLAVNWRGRALPIYCRVFRYCDIETSQNLLEEDLLKTLWPLLPTDYRYILVADRGFGRADLAKFLQAQGIAFILRVKDDVYVTHRGKTHLLSRYHLRLGECHLYRKVFFRKDQVVQVNLVIAHLAYGSKIPAQQWCLITSLNSADEAVDGYFCRMQIEEFFRDDKHHLHMEDSGTGTVAHWERLLIGLSCSYLILAAIGLQEAVQANAARVMRLRTGKDTKKAPRGSLIWLALQVLRTPLYFSPEVVPRALAALRASRAQ